METINIKDIKIESNVRFDYGNLDELVQSIKENGIRTPVLLTKDHVLIDGHRRIKAAETTGVKEIPYVIQDKAINRTIDQIILGVLPKNLDPTEEAAAYQELSKTMDIDKIAKKVGKTPAYVKRRLKLLKLTKEVKESLQNKKIQIGHAELIGQLSKDQQKEVLKLVIDEDLTVQNLADHLYFTDIDLSGYEFRTDEGFGKLQKEKTLFDSIGEYLNPKFEVGNTLSDRDKFKPQLLKYIERERKRIRDAGIRVFNSEEDLKKAWPHHERLWGRSNKEVLDNLTDNANYAILIGIDDNYGYTTLEKEIYKRLDPPKPEKPSSKKYDYEEEPSTPVNKALDPQFRLNKKVESYAHTLLQEHNQISTIKQSKVMAIYELMNNWRWKDYEEFKNVTKDWERHVSGFKGFYLNAIPYLNNLSEEELDNLLLRVIQKEYVVNREFPVHREIAEMTGFDIAKNFKLDEEYVKMYTKDQLIELGKELGIEEDILSTISKGKRSECEAEVIKAWKEGTVPVILNDMITIRRKEDGSK